MDFDSTKPFVCLLCLCKFAIDFFGTNNQRDIAPLFCTAKNEKEPSCYYLFVPMKSNPSTSMVVSIGLLADISMIASGVKEMSA